MRCIYKITNLVNGKIYIGQTTRTIEARFNDHWWDAQRFMQKELDGKLNKHDSRLYRALIKYGKDNFKIESIHILEPDEDINQLEIFYIKLLDAQNPDIGYNIAEGGNKPPARLNWHHSEATRQRQSEAQKEKKWYNNGHTEIMVFKGQDPPPDFIKGRLNSQGFKKGCLNPQYGKPGINLGKHLTNETKDKLSDSQKNRLAKKQLIWVHNDLHEIQIDLLKGQEIPEGYIKGRLRTNLAATVKVKIVNLTNNTEAVYNSYTEAITATGLAFATINKSIKNNCIVKNKYICSIV